LLNMSHRDLNADRHFVINFRSAAWAGFSGSFQN
jgi:hypothetical protein